MYDVARQLSRRVPFPKLVNLEKDVRLYFATILVDAVFMAGETLKVPEGMKLEAVPAGDWQRTLMEMAGSNYEAYGLVAPRPTTSDNPTVSQRLDDLAQGLQAMQRAFNQAVSG